MSYKVATEVVDDRYADRQTPDAPPLIADDFFAVVPGARCRMTARLIWPM